MIHGIVTWKRTQVGSYVLWHVMCPVTVGLWIRVRVDVHAGFVGRSIYLTNEDSPGPMLGILTPIIRRKKCESHRTKQPGGFSGR